MARATIDGIPTRYEVVGSGPPLLMYAPGGFAATVETWSTQGVYAKIKLLEHLPKKYTCVLFDRRECGQSGGRVERVTWAHYVTRARDCSTTSASNGPTSWAAAWDVAP
jgi:pimeloyl-ACP methyl ester carboxylesterase